MTPYYQEDGITIYNGDCNDVLQHLGKFDLCLTDPPYGIGFAAQPTKWQRAAGSVPESWDDLATVGIDKIISYGSDQIVWGGNYFGLSVTKSWLSWFKPDAPPSMGAFELAWTNLKTNTRQISHSIAATNKERCGHPTQKPLAVMKWCLQFSPYARSVIDPFMGSGTTLVACKNSGISCVGIELDKKYCDMAIARLRQGALFA